MAERLFDRNRTVVPSADVSAEKYLELIPAIANVPGIEAVKIGFAIGYRITLARAAEIAHNSGLKVIMDHQKAGSDIPDTGKEFAAVCKEAKIDAAIIFPQAGPATGESWIKALQDIGITTIVGGEMTHPKYKRSEGGYISDDALPEMYLLGAENGVRNFVVPGNRVERVATYKELLDDAIGKGKYRFQSPGFVDQGGKISSYVAAAGEMWDAIVGRAITTASNMREAAEEMTSQIR